MGKIYLEIDTNPEKIQSLTHDPLVTSQTKLYETEILSCSYLQDLAAVVTTLKQENKPEIERAIALSAYGVLYSFLQKELTEKAVPGIKLKPTVKKTIEDNPFPLTESQIILIKAAQLSMTLNLQKQYEMDSTTFDRMFPTTDKASCIIS